MSWRKIAAGLVMAGLVAAFAPGAAFAQAAAGDPDLNKLMEEVLKKEGTRIKAELGVSDDEWKVLEPRINKVRARPFASEPDAVLKAREALQEELKNKNAEPKDVAEKMTALRDATAKAKKEQDKARADLKELLTVRQEAVLVRMGMLD